MTINFPIIKRHTSLYRDNDVIIKKFHPQDVESVRRLTDEWFEHYQQLSKDNDCLVKVIRVVNDVTLEMEYLDIIDSVRNLLRCRQCHRLVSKELIAEIVFTLNNTWSQSIQYSAKNIPGNNFFIHCDLHLDNLVVTRDRAIKIIDPDSFRMVSNFILDAEDYFTSQVSLWNSIQYYFQCQ